MRQYFFAPVLLLFFAVAGCNTLEPVQTAETPEQKAFALVGTYTIYKEIAADLSEDPDTPDAVVFTFERLVSVADPAQPLVKSAAMGLADARADLREIENETTLDKFAVALRVFNQRWAESAPALQNFIDAVKEQL